MPDQSPVILYTEDHELERRALTPCLQREGFVVWEARTGEETFRLLADKPDLVLMDVNLPDMHGIEVCRKIKTDPATNSIPVLHVSGTFCSSENRVEALTHGADGYLVKPLHPLEVIAHVRALLRMGKAEKLARTAAGQWQSTFDAISDPIWLVAQDGNVLQCNGAMQELLGGPVVAETARGLQDLLQEALRPAEPAAGADGEPQRHRKTGEVAYNGRWFRATEDIVVGDQGTTLGSIQVLGDITERKRAGQEISKLIEDLQRRTGELESANKELDAFCYSVSHDLRAPARGIMGLSRILLGEFRSDLPPQVQRYLQMLYDNGCQMGHLIDDLLSFSRLGRQPLKKQLVGSADIVRLCLAELDPERDGRKVEILLEKLPSCQADPGLLKQVWHNLISNAFKYTAKQDAARVEIGSTEEPGRGCVFYIRDNGVGFDMRYVKKLFGVFQRLHGFDEYEGTGVGLAIVQRIIQRHGGQVWAEAEVNRGATFYFTLCSEG